MRFTRLICVLLGSLLLFACGEAEETPTPAPTETAVALEIATVAAPTEAAVPDATDEPPTAAPTATPIPPTPTPEPIASTVAVEDQAVDSFGVIAIAEVTSENAGVVALSNDAGVLGWTAFEAGTNENLLVEINPYRATDLLTVSLYEGTASSFEFESAEPILQDGEPVSAELNLSFAFEMSEVAVTDHDVLDDGMLTIDALTMHEDGWIAVYNDNDGDWGERVGLQFAAAGNYTPLKVALNWRIATPTLHVVLHHDNSRAGRFDYPTADEPMMMQNNAVAAAVNVTYPPDIFFMSQPVVSDTIIIDRVISNGPGWLAVSQQQAELELPGNVIGFAYLEDGVNEMVEVEMLPGYATSVLYLQLHEDELNMGEFDYPGGDNPIRYFDEPRIFELDAEPGNYLVSTDQVVDTTSDTTDVRVPLVVADLPLWVLIRLDQDGLPGDVIGSYWAGPGIHRDIDITIETGDITPILHVVLHIDRDEIQLLEFPEGRDFELQRRQAPIDSPFKVLEE